MNCHFRYLPFVCFALLASLLKAQDAQQRAIDFVGASYSERIKLRDGFSETERQEVIKEIKRKLALPEYHKEPLVRGLAFLGDEEALQELARDFIARDSAGPDGLAQMQSPRLIELVAPEFYREELEIMGGGDVVILPPSFRAAKLAVKTVAATPAFNAETRQWAEGLRGLTGTEIRVLVRPWWRANEQFFREKNYTAVRPGPPRPRDPYATQQPAVLVPPPAAPATPPAGATPSSLAPPAVEKPSPLSRTPWLGYVVAGALALLLAAALYLSTRRRE